MTQVIKIRACAQCGDVLPQKCTRCIKHPTRKPLVLDIHELPPILKRAECGCIQFRCQREGCNNTLWRGISRARQAKQQFCSPNCATIVRTRNLIRRVEVTCSNPLCGKKISKIPCEIKTWRKSYCHRACKHIGQRILKQAEIAARKKADSDSGAAALLHCAKCRTVTEHEKSGAGYRCGACQAHRIVSQKVLA